MTPEAREALRVLLAKATPGRWRIGEMGRPLPHVVDMGPQPHSPFAVCHADDGSGPSNAALIVAAVNALPTLLDHQEAQDARIEAHREVLAELLRTIMVPDGFYDTSYLTAAMERGRELLRRSNTMPSDTIPAGMVRFSCEQTVNPVGKAG